MGRFVESDTETCARCPRRVVQIIKLAGGYAATLCAQCDNDWGAVVNDDPLFEEFSRASERYAVILTQAAFNGGYEANGEAITAARMAIRGIEKRLYAMAKQWVLRCAK